MHARKEIDFSVKVSPKCILADVYITRYKLACILIMCGLIFKRTTVTVLSEFKILKKNFPWTSVGHVLFQISIKTFFNNKQM